MSRFSPARDNNIAVLSAVEEWKSRCLLKQGSLFSEISLWNIKNIQSLVMHFVKNPDPSENNFLNKLKGQLASSTPEAKQLAAEMLYILRLFPSNIGHAKKREVVLEVWSWSGSFIDPTHFLLTDSILQGVGSGGMAFNTNLWRELTYFILFMQAYLTLPDSDREALLADGWRMDEWLEALPENNSRQFRHMLLFLLFPDLFERISGGVDRVAIVSEFTGEDRKSVQKYSPIELDRRLHDIREKQAEVYGTPDLDFYRSPLKEVWKKEPSNNWIFQANLQFYDIISALRDGKLKSWTIKTHKGDIAKGDRVIIWVTGTDAGCYALCEVTSELLEGEDIEDLEYYRKEPAAGPYSYVKLLVKENLWDAPITKNDAASIPELTALKVGHQGTVFMATASEYEAMQALAKQRAKNTNGQNYWLYAPGPQSNNWEECWDKGEMVIGFDATSDLRSYKDRAEIEKALAMTRTNEARPINDSLAAWDFLHQLKYGDVIIAKRGRQAYLGYGIVKGEYEYDANRESFRHFRRVEWIKRGEWPEISGPIVLKTLTDITKYPDYVEKLKALIGIGKPQRQSIELPSKNVILFGPPGSGKTYTLRTKYMDLFTDHASVKTQEEYADELVSSMAWWEVITMVMLDINSGQVADILSHPLLQARIRRSENSNPRAAVWAHIQMHTKRDCEHVAYTKRYEPLLFSKSDKSVWSIDKEAAHAEVPELEDKLTAFKNYSPSSASAIRRYAFATFHQSFSYEDFVEGIKPVMGEDLVGELAYEIQPGVFRQIAQRAKNDPDHDYALFIDEINRGNIASIFGELITLLEDDKRTGEKHEMSAVLPYSRHEFGVPSNLYVVGTMNTADRSVEALDTALRRRFTFVECGPQPYLLREQQPTDLHVDLEKLLMTINARIERLLDSDHCIGHSYFMGMKEVSDPLTALRKAFANKIMPMLQEYFYGNPGRIGMVLGEKFVQRRDAAPLAVGDWGIDGVDERDIYKFADPMLLPAEAFVSIYE